MSLRTIINYQPVPMQRIGMPRTHN